jgi:hypothetical protein
LGVWAKQLHEWGRSDGAKELRERLFQDTEARKLKLSVNYGLLIAVIDRMPHVLEESRGLFLKVKQEVEARREKTDQEMGIIHGDFWTGK